MNYYMDAWRHYADFSGRARRKAYWLFVLFNAIAYVLVSIADAMLGGSGILAIAYYLAILIPSISIFFRRLHDTGRSGWWWLIGLVPFIGGIVLLVFLCLDSQPGDNTYGPNPKGVGAPAAPAAPTPAPPAATV